MTEYNVRYDFYTVCKFLNNTEYYIAPDDIEAGDDTWLHNGVQIILTEDGMTWKIITDTLFVYDTAYQTNSGSGAQITFNRGTAEDLHQLAVQVRLVSG